VVGAAVAFDDGVSTGCVDGLIGGQEGFNEGGPLGLQGGAVVFGAGAVVPVVGVPLLAFFAMQVSVDGHGVRGGELVDESVGAGPVVAGVPPESFERSGEVGRRDGLGEGGGEVGWGHSGLRCC
jgi:hypothetical protein